MLHCTKGTVKRVFFKKWHHLHGAYNLQVLKQLKIIS